MHYKLLSNAESMMFIVVQLLLKICDIVKYFFNFTVFCDCVF